MFALSRCQRRAFERARRKYNVSLEFINYNIPNILKFLAYHAKRFTYVLKRCVVRNHRNRSIVIKYNHLRQSFLEMQRKRRRRNLRQWSKRMVLYLRKEYGVKEYVVVEKTSDCRYSQLESEEVSKQLKEQLDLLRNGKRSTQLIDCSGQGKNKYSLSPCDSNIISDSDNPFENAKSKEKSLNFNNLTTENGNHLKEKTLNDTNKNIKSNDDIALEQNTISDEKQSSNLKSNPGILDLLMKKVGASVISQKEEVIPSLNTCDQDTSADSGEEFLGFSEDDHIPGMMRTPLVPSLSRTKDDNSVFISETLDEYFRENSLDMDVNVEKLTSSSSFNRKLRQANINGLMTLNCVPPTLVMPAVPLALQKLRTVAERRQYLQKFSKNYKLAIINNEATIYRELQRKIRQPKLKITTQQAFQATNSKMSFTRQGWRAASFITTDINKYYFQKVLVDNREFEVRGVLGNNVNRYKKPHLSKISKIYDKDCDINCADCSIRHHFQIIPTIPNKKKLCDKPLRSIFKPCPLSQKPFQPILDGELGEALITGRNLSVVRLPIVELNVYPEVGKPFNDIAKRYLEYVMPFQSITREWAEFSLSTLRVSNEDCKRKKSFTFPIPYVNDRSHILVRRVVNRSEKLDPYFRRTSDTSSIYNLSFRANLDENDEVLMECADVLTDMINSVAINCSENSFTTTDPDEMYVESNLPTVLPKSKTKNLSKGQIQTKNLPSKKNRLISELRRLNATIIRSYDSNIQEKNELEPCPKEFCTLGCVCESIGNNYPFQSHCAKPQCMLGCECAKKTNSQILRLKSNSQTISQEDAYMMRREATSRLARIEKEFTSTVVVTENETLLINDSQYDKKRRCAKIPKRYEDFRGPDEDLSRLSPIKSSSALPTDPNEPKRLITKSTNILDLVSIKDVVLQKLKHCSVSLMRLEDINNMAVFCMIHQLYNCFCGGRATEGKRIIIEKESPNTKILQDNDSLNLKSTYTFERLKEKSPNTSPQTETTASASSEIFYTQDSNSSNSDDKIYREELKVRNKTSVKRKLSYAGLDFATEYFKKSEKIGCTRFVPIPALTYASLNKKRRSISENFIKNTENKRTRLLLNERIMRSVYFYKINSNPKVKEEMSSLKQIKTTEQLEQIKYDKIQQLHEKIVCEEVPKKSTMSSQTNSSPVASGCLSEKRKVISHTDSHLIVKKVKTNVMDNVDIPLRKEENTKSSIAKEEHLPKTSTSVSIDVEELNNSEAKKNSNQFTMGTSIEVSYVDCAEMKEHFNDVIKTLNTLVSRKMHDIDNALKRNSKIVPPPTEDILCVLQWGNFLDAFREGLIFVWEVKMKTRTFLAATVANTIPMILGSLAVINISTVPQQRLPLLGSMLINGCTVAEHMNLAVIMQGRSQYWYIKGFLRPILKNVCLKPTPHTHPALTQKINSLSMSLVRQRLKEKEKRTAPTNRVSEIKSEEIKSNESSPNSVLTLKKPPSSMTKTQYNLQSKQESDRLKGLSSFNDSAKQKYTNTSFKSPTIISQAKQLESLESNNVIEKSKRDDLKQSNIEVREANLMDIKDLRQPECHSNDHRWFVLDIQNDFSHIYVPEQKEIVSLDRIQRLIKLSQEQNKVIQIQFKKRASYDAYIVPGSIRKVYFGPFGLDTEPPVIVLLQSVDGKMMIRETYQLVHKIPKKPECTTAFWMTLKNGEIALSTNSDKIPKSISKSKNRISDDDDDEEDCVIIVNNKQQASLNTKDLTMNSNEPPTSLVTNKKTQSLIKKTSPYDIGGQHINFTIQTSNKTNQLKIIPSIETKDDLVQSDSNSNAQSKDIIRQKVFISELLPNNPNNTNILQSISEKGQRKIVEMGKPPCKPIMKTSPYNVAQQSLVKRNRILLNSEKNINNSGVFENTNYGNNIGRYLVQADLEPKRKQTPVVAMQTKNDVSGKNGNQECSSASSSSSTNIKAIQIGERVKNKIFDIMSNSSSNIVLKPQPNVLCKPTTPQKTESLPQQRNFSKPILNIKTMTPTFKLISTTPAGTIMQRSSNFIVENSNKIPKSNIELSSAIKLKTNSTVSTLKAKSISTLPLPTKIKSNLGSSLYNAPVGHSLLKRNNLDFLNSTLSSNSTNPINSSIASKKIRLTNTVMQVPSLVKIRPGVSFKPSVSTNAIINPAILNKGIPATTVVSNDLSTTCRSEKPQIIKVTRICANSKTPNTTQNASEVFSKNMTISKSTSLGSTSRLQSNQASELQLPSVSGRCDQEIDIATLPSLSSQSKNKTTVDSLSRVYGYFTSNISTFPKLFAQRKQNEYFIRIFGGGIARVKNHSQERINNFLNRQVVKMKGVVTENVTWKFEPLVYSKKNYNATQSQQIGLSNKKTKSEMQLDIVQPAKSKVPQLQIQNSETIVID